MNENIFSLTVSYLLKTIEVFTHAMCLGIIIKIIMSSDKRLGKSMNRFITRAWNKVWKKNLILNENTPEPIQYKIDIE